ncbi:unnamed protein product [Rhizopus stolonifer]
MFSLSKTNIWSAVSQTSTVISNVFQRPAILTSVRHASDFSPRRTKYKKAHKGKIPIPIGGSTKGTTVQFGDFGLRLKEGARLTSRQLTAVHHTLRRKIKPIKGFKFGCVYSPIFLSQARVTKIIFEIGGMRKEIAKEAFRLVAQKLPVKTEMVERGTKPIVGAHGIPPTTITTTTTATATTNV